MKPANENPKVVARSGPCVEFTSKKKTSEKKKNDPHARNMEDRTTLLRFSFAILIVRNI
jgi:hypothetical protein